MVWCLLRGCYAAVAAAASSSSKSLLKKAMGVSSYTLPIEKVGRSGTGSISGLGRFGYILDYDVDYSMRSRQGLRYGLLDLSPPRGQRELRY